MPYCCNTPFRILTDLKLHLWSYKLLFTWARKFGICSKDGDKCTYDTLALMCSKIQNSQSWSLNCTKTVSCPCTCQKGMQESGGIALCILILWTTYRWEVSFTPWLLYAQAKCLSYPFSRRLVWTLGRWEKSLVPAGNWTMICQFYVIHTVHFLIFMISTWYLSWIMINILLYFIKCIYWLIQWTWFASLPACSLVLTLTMPY